MIVIVEGPDGSGKTTLAEQLAKDLDLPYLRPPTLSSTAGPDLEVFKWWRNAITEEEPGVYDRCFFVSELLYQLVSPRSLLVDGKIMEAGIHDLWVVDPVMVFCMTDWAQEEPILQSRPGLQGVEELYKFQKIHWAYWSMYAMWRESLSHVHHYDYRKPNAYEALRGRMIDD